jgi:hypothetical protein
MGRDSIPLPSEPADMTDDETAADRERVITRRGLSPRFADPELEHEYRQWALPDDRRQVLFITSVLSVSWLCFIPNDYRLFGLGHPFWSLMALRLWQIGLGVAVTLIVYRNNSERLFSLLVGLFWLSTLVAIWLVDLTRPTVSFIHLFLDFFAVFIMYTLMPNHLPLQVVPGLIATALGLGYAITYRHALGAVSLHVVIITYILINAFGVILSWRQNIERRRLFQALHRVRLANTQLTSALTELKTLRGIIPICANCKKIRDDAGYWHQVEIYIRDHSEAQFSHGLCPECIEKLYPKRSK